MNSTFTLGLWTTKGFSTAPFSWDLLQEAIDSRDFQPIIKESQEFPLLIFCMKEEKTFITYTNLNAPPVSCVIYHLWENGEYRHINAIEEN